MKIRSSGINAIIMEDTPRQRYRTEIDNSRYWEEEEIQRYPESLERAADINVAYEEQKTGFRSWPALYSTELDGYLEEPKGHPRLEKHKRDETDEEEKDETDEEEKPVEFLQPESTLDLLGESPILATNEEAKAVNVSTMTEEEQPCSYLPSNSDGIFRERVSIDSFEGSAHVTRLSTLMPLPRSLSLPQLKSNQNMYRGKRPDRWWFIGAAAGGLAFLATVIVSLTRSRLL